MLIPWCEQHGVSSWEQLDQNMVDGLRIQLVKRGNPLPSGRDLPAQPGDEPGYVGWACPAPPGSS